MPKLNVQRTLRGLAIAYISESIVMFALTFLVIWGMATATEKSLLTDIALVLLTLGSAIWLLNAAKAILQGKRWARSAGIFWQLLQLAIAYGTFEASILGALAIAIPSLGVFIILFNKQVVAATMN